MFKIKYWYNPREDDINFEKETMIDMDMLDTTYQDIITNFVLNKMLHHVGMLWIIETHEQLKYDKDKQNS